MCSHMIQSSSYICIFLVDSVLSSKKNGKRRKRTRHVWLQSSFPKEHWENTGCDCRLKTWKWRSRCCEYFLRPSPHKRKRARHVRTSQMTPGWICPHLTECQHLGLGESNATWYLYFYPPRINHHPLRLSSPWQPPHPPTPQHPFSLDSFTTFGGFWWGKGQKVCLRAGRWWEQTNQPDYHSF